MDMEVEDPGGPVSPAAGKIRENSGEQRGTEEEEEAKPGGPTSMTARKTTMRRVGCDSLSSWTYHRSVQAKVASGHQKSCHFVLPEYSKCFFRTNEFGEQDISQRDNYENSRDSGGIYLQELHLSPDGWHKGIIEEKWGSAHPPRNRRGNKVPQEPEESYDHEPRTFHDTRSVCAIPGNLSQRNMGDYQWHHERWSS